ncbi:FAD:protein FMN transferase [Oricola nitratireducens]|uniref:FAD:protein FMN transferase n=1 Tax=Oricola nitratireducens TaxID=2775868 RepID=UPI0018661189|nr:FAD:protein FMN transferase [Oricola nitratireducens]
MSTSFNRRRFLQIAAAATLMPETAFAAGKAFRWHGTSLGARSSMFLVGVDQIRGREIAVRVQAEIDRLESIFSLYRADSAVRTLNERGRLEHPPSELLEVLSLCGALAAITDGAFDPTVQPVWRLYSECMRRGREPSFAELAQACRSVGWSNVAYGPDEIGFEQPGMAITLNGIAQGYITDRIAEMLRAEGLSNLLIDMGEIAAAGEHGDGSPWQAGIADTKGRIVRRIQLRNRALATSAPSGTVLDPAGRVGHIFDPRTGIVAKRWNLISVSAPTAAIADGLSTGFCALSRPEIGAVLESYVQAKVETII